MNNSLYIAGKMRGVENFNFDAFDAAEGEVTALGYHPISPAAMDRFYEGWAKYPPKDWKPCPCDAKRMMRRDLAAIDDCYGVYMLRGWETSTGAKVEKAYAEFLGKKVLFQEEGVKKSGQDWQDEVAELVVVMDPDGWDRKNYAESWAEPITKAEFLNRVSYSTCGYPDLQGLIAWSELP